MYGCSVAATANAKFKGNTDTVKLNLPEISEAELGNGCIDQDDELSSIGEDTGYQVIECLVK